MTTGMNLEGGAAARDAISVVSVTSAPEMVLSAVAEEFGWSDPDAAMMQAYTALGLVGAIPTRESARRVVTWLKENAR